jgi:uncharacterized protein YuzE
MSGTDMHHAVTGEVGVLSGACLCRCRSKPGGGGNSIHEKQDKQILAGGVMKVSYDSRTDTLSVVLKEDAVVAESDEDKPGIILDYDQDGNLISLEILDASERVSDARKVDFQLAE